MVENHVVSFKTSLTRMATQVIHQVSMELHCKVVDRKGDMLASVTPLHMIQHVLKIKNHIDNECEMPCRDLTGSSVR